MIDNDLEPSYRKNSHNQVTKGQVLIPKEDVQIGAGGIALWKKGLAANPDAWMCLWDSHDRRRKDSDRLLSDF